ncbi:MAG: aminotransferase class I/II-fold pyridoxal phosphate-dependent enzyme [Actinobacteria bacterium]|nr:aminotransferase class I/II-fold pyridoxal phosphate-dependent enzyme [Actinomycetota bacterium]
MHPSTRTARAPGRADPQFGGLVPPIFPSATYVRDDDGSYPGGHSYSRDQNPTGEPAEALLAELEGGEAALLFSSGMAAATALLDSLEAGTHVVAPRRMYWTIRRWLHEESIRGRLRLTLVDNEDVRAWESALGNAGPHLLWFETPSNPMGDILDLRTLSDLGHAEGALVVADNTTATPVHTRPIDHGADVVFHSATKQLNGHGDVLAGALVTKVVDDVWTRVRHQRGYRGAVLGPFEAWLLLRGMKTLFVRVPRSSSTALAVARGIDGHRSIERVLYPGLPSHPQHELASRQMDGGYGMLLSLRVRGGEGAARAVMNALALFADATSLGSTESLVEHRSRIEGAGTPVPADLLRLSIGLEHADDLLADLYQALDRAP